MQRRGSLFLLRHVISLSGTAIRVVLDQLLPQRQSPDVAQMSGCNPGVTQMSGRAAPAISMVFRVVPALFCSSKVVCGHPVARRKTECGVTFVVASPYQFEIIPVPQPTVYECVAAMSMKDSERISVGSGVCRFQPVVNIRFLKLFSERSFISAGMRRPGSSAICSR